MSVPDATLPEDTRQAVTGGESGLASGDQLCGRFVVEGVLGRGSSGEVLSVRELPLDRHVAMKVLRGAGGPVIARFMREARLTARIDHPNVPPVHFLEFLPDGGLLFTMRRLDGQSLGEAIRSRVSGASAPQIASVNAIIQIIQRVCDALARAHALGIVHRDVKPDNIMLGAHGEVALVDWGECRLLDEPDNGPAGSTVGTPAYMSPEQARGEPADQRSDVYALGATLFHALTGHLPTWDADPDAFWQKKRDGVLDPLPAAVEDALPRHLLAISRRAMSPGAAQRYATASDLAAELDRFQAGLSIEAYRDSLLGYLGRWYRRHRLPVWSIGLALAVTVPSLWLLWESRLREIADWGRPVVVEDFSDDSWKERWIIHDGAAERRDGRLVTTGDGPFLLLCRRQMPGATAIEFEGEMLPGCPPCDLSAFWCASRSERTDSDPFSGLRDVTLLQAGAYANTCAVIFRPDVSAALDFAAFKLENGRRYRIRAEVDGSRLALSVDGRILCESQATIPLGSGYIGIYGYYRGKAFDAVRVWSKGQAERQPSTAVGDALYRLGHAQEAAAAYDEVERSLDGRPIAIEARFRGAVCRLLAGDRAGARQALESLLGGPLSEQAELQLLDADFADGDHAAVLARLERLTAGADRQLRKQCAARWALYVGALEDAKPPPREVVDRYLAVRERRFTGEPFLQFVLARVLQHRGRYQELLAECPDIGYQCALALAMLGRHEEAATRYPQITWVAPWSFLQSGRPEEVIKRYPDHPRATAEALLMLGKRDEALRAASAVPEYQAELLAYCGRFAEALAHPSAGPWTTLTCLRALGRLAEAEARLSGHPDACAQAFLGQHRYDEVLSRFPDRPVACATALLMLGRWDEVPDQPETAGVRAQIAYYRDPQGFRLPAGNEAELRWVAVEIACDRGTAEEQLGTLTGDDGLRGHLLNHLGRPAEVLRRCARQRGACAQALLLLGNADAVLADYPEDMAACADARGLLCLRAAEAGCWSDALAAAAGCAASPHGSGFASTLLHPLLRRFAAQAGRLEEDDLEPVLALRQRGDLERSWYNAAFLAGRVDEAEFLAQPHRPGAPTRLRLCQAIRADLAGDGDAAVHGYRAWNAESSGHRGLDPVQAAFVRWRLGAISQKAGR